MDTVDKPSSAASQAAVKATSATRRTAKALGKKKERQLKAAELGWMESCSGYVRDNPLTSVGIAVGGGFLVSRLLSGR